MVRIDRLEIVRAYPNAGLDRNLVEADDRQMNHG